MKKEIRCFLIILGFLLFSIEAYFRKIEKFNFMFSLTLGIITALLLLHLFFTSLSEIKQKPENFSLYLILVSFLLLARNYYLGFPLKDVSLKLLIFNGVMFLYYASSRNIKMPKKILVIYAMGIILLAIIVVALNSKTLLTQMFA